jgi:hypothetical protein
MLWDEPQHFKNIKLDNYLLATIQDSSNYLHVTGDEWMILQYCQRVI